jgi:hypothetical protein
MSGSETQRDSRESQREATAEEDIVKLVTRGGLGIAWISLETLGTLGTLGNLEAGGKACELAFRILSQLFSQLPNRFNFFLREP